MRCREDEPVIDRNPARPIPNDMAVEVREDCYHSIVSISEYQSRVE